jgi:hypothetical protein
MYWVLRGVQTGAEERVDHITQYFIEEGYESSTLYGNKVYFVSRIKKRLMN